MPSISTSLSQFVTEEERIIEKIQNIQYEISDRKKNDDRDHYFELLEKNIADLKQRQKEIRLYLYFCTVTQFYNKTEKEMSKLRDEGSRIGILSIIFTLCLLAALHFFGIIDVMPFLQQFYSNTKTEESPFHTPSSPKYDIRP